MARSVGRGGGSKSGGRGRTQKRSTAKKRSSTKRSSSKRSAPACTYARCVALVQRTERLKAGSPGRGRASTERALSFAAGPPMPFASERADRERRARGELTPEEYAATFRRDARREAWFDDFDMPRGRKARDWFDDFEGHSQASKAGWADELRGRRPPSRPKRKASAASRDWWQDDPIRRKRAAVLGWETRLGRAEPKNPTFGGYRRPPLFSPVATQKGRQKRGGAKSSRDLTWAGDMSDMRDPFFASDPGHDFWDRDPARSRKKTSSSKKRSASSGSSSRGKKKRSSSGSSRALALTSGPRSGGSSGRSKSRSGTSSRSGSTSRSGTASRSRTGNTKRRSSSSAKRSTGTRSSTKRRTSTKRRDLSSRDLFY